MERGRDNTERGNRVDAQRTENQTDSQLMRREMISPTSNNNLPRSLLPSITSSNAVSS